MPKFKIITLGCRVNQAESEAIAGRMAEARWTAAGPDEAADLCIVNTCAVTRRAAMQSRQALRRAVQENPAACVAATGCCAATDPQALRAIKGVAVLIDQKDKLLLPEVLSAGGVEGILLERLPAVAAGAALAESAPAWEASRQDAAPAEKAAARSSLPPPLTKGAGGILKSTLSTLPPAGARTRPLLKVQDGCEAFCAYCIVPYARGPSRSLPLPAALESVSRLAARGFREAVLTGIHLGNYGKDLAPRTSLIELLRAILERPDAVRIRLSSIEPLELTDALIELAAGSERICRHFHVPLQSGDAQVLKRMGRPYTPEEFAERVAQVRRRLPEAAIGADVLIGFPGETEAAFENTYALVERLPLTYLHVFPFSARPGTAAWALSDPVPSEAIRRRCARMRQLGSRKRLDFHRRFVGRRVAVLAEGRREPKTGLLKGVSSNYLPVLFEGGDELFHRPVAVRVSRADAVRLHGSPEGRID